MAGFLSDFLTEVMEGAARELAKPARRRRKTTPRSKRTRRTKTSVRRKSSRKRTTRTAIEKVILEAVLGKKTAGRTGPKRRVRRTTRRRKSAALAAGTA